MKNKKLEIFDLIKGCTLEENAFWKNKIKIRAKTR